MDLELLKFLAARNVCDGILYEPRVYAQKFNFSQANTLNPQFSDEDIFRNGEQYPVRITHMLAAIRDGNGLAGSTNERLTQAYGLRVRVLDTFYMNDDAVPLPAFNDVVTAASDIVSKSTSSWRFAHPFFMGGRDSLSVQVALEYPVDQLTEGSIRVWVTFHGFGALSRRPKELHGNVVFDSASAPVLTIADGFYRNDGTEPLEVHSMVINVEPPTGSAGSDPLGNIRRARVSVRQIGNGTNQRWTNSEAFNLDTVAASLFGVTSGRAVTHVLPIQTDLRGRGWIWEPNQGLTLEVSGPQSGPALSELYIALLGEIIVK